MPDRLTVMPAPSPPVAQEPREVPSLVPQPAPARRRDWTGLALAAGSFLLILAWAAATRPLNAPDEPAHLQAVMTVRNQHRLPEVHYIFPSPTGQVVGEPGDARVRAYTQTLRRGTYVLIPYESMQAPLYYLVAGVA